MEVLPLFNIAPVLNILIVEIVIGDSRFFNPCKINHYVAKTLKEIAQVDFWQLRD